MSNLRIEATEKTPFVNFDSHSKMFLIKGKSIPENTIKFYQELIDFLNSFITNTPQSPFTLQFQLEYFNTSSAKRILELMKIAQRCFDAGIKDVCIKWTFEEGDTDMEEAGEDFKNLLHVPFQIFSVPVED